MPAKALHIFLSFDPSDAQTARDLERHLQQAMEGQPLRIWKSHSVPDEKYRPGAGAFLEKTNLFIACLSSRYLDHPNVRWELDHALAEQKRRPDLQCMTALAQGAFVPELLRSYPLAPAPGQPVEGWTLGREIQLQRCAEAARDILFQVDRALLPAGPARAEYTLTFEDVRERVHVWLEQCDLEPAISLLKQLLHPERTPDDLFQLEDAFAEWRQQSRRTQLTFELFQQTVQAIRLDLQHLLNRLEEDQYRSGWADIFAAYYYGLKPLDPPADTLAGLFLPAAEILIPESLNLPGAVRDQEVWEGAGTLSLQQQQEFRRYLLLAQDSMGVGNHTRAHAQCEHVRHHLDPQSAQLYELLLITYLKQETPDRIIHDAIYGNSTKLHHVVVYASRLAEYQRHGKCPTESAYYNLRAAAEALSNALLRLYATFQNDYILHTGRYAEEVPDNRNALSRSVQVAMEIYRTVHPYRGFMELAFNELCNGGKYDYIRQTDIIADEFRFSSHEDFGLESEIREVVGMLEAISPDDDDALMNHQLRENLFFNLRAKRVRLEAQVLDERRHFRQFTDVRDSVIELIHAALLGYKIFGDRDYDSAFSFLRLAVEQLLPGLLLPTASSTPAAAVAGLRWFDLDEQGEVRTHPECARYHFDALGVVEKIVRDHAGKAGWLQVHPNIKQEVFLQFVADTDAEYQLLRDNLQWTDIRRMNEVEARRRIIQCLRRWKIAWLAYPTTGERYLQHILYELAGDRLLLWLRFDPPRLSALPDSLGLGYDALAEFRSLLELPSGLSQETVYKVLAHNLFQRHILPAYGRIRTGDESRRAELASLLLQALLQYRDLHPAPEYLDFVYHELTEENKLRWVDVSETGEWQAWTAGLPFSPMEVLEQLVAAQPGRYRMLDVRQHIARRRHQDLQARYFREVSEYTHENRQVEREITIGIIRKMKGLFRFYPDAAFLELPIRELEGNGRIRWQENFLGVFPTRQDHYENQYYRFDYRKELAECRMYRKTRQQWMEHVLKEIGELG